MIEVEKIQYGNNNNNEFPTLETFDIDKMVNKICLERESGQKIGIVVFINISDFTREDAKNNFQRFTTTLMEKTNEYLKDYFEEIHLREDTPPYDELISFKLGKYWLLRGPKA